MTPVRAILFDYDGVLADTLADMLRFGGETCAEMGYPCAPTPADLGALENMSLVDYGIQLGIPVDQAQEFARRMAARFAAMEEIPGLFPGMDAVVRAAASRGQVGIVTGNSGRSVSRFLDRHGLRAAIEVLISVEQPGTRAEKLAAALAQMGRQPQEACLVGDAVSDVRACRELGVRSIGVAWGHQSAARLAAAGADMLASSPQELAKLLLRI